MATAICRICTPEGFVIAADGREREAAANASTSDEEQKIFRLHHRRGAMSCAVTGTARIGKTFRLSNEIPRTARTLEDCDALNICEYADHLGNDLKLSLESRFPGLNSTVIFQLLLDGYISGRPSRARAIVKAGLESDSVAIRPQELFLNKSIGAGSDTIHQALFSQELRDESLRPYWIICRQELRTIDQSVAVARAVIEAHCNTNVLSSLDPKSSASFGGHIHIAKITASHGFEWVARPITEAS
jgi:hypothetical protein